MSDHCVLDLTAPDNVVRMRCTRCGDFLDLRPPIRVSTLEVIGDAFKAMHAACKPKPWDNEP